jgi:surface antigen
MIYRATALAATAFVLAGCSGPGGAPTKGDVGLGTGVVLGGVIGNQFGKGSGRVFGTVAGAFIGGILGHDIGRQLDERDRMMAQQAEMEAFERGYAGRPVGWRSERSGYYGEVIPQEPYERYGRRCRDYTHRVYIQGRPEVLRGTACRNPDGTWTSVG